MEILDSCSENTQTQHIFQSEGSINTCNKSTLEFYRQEYTSSFASERTSETYSSQLNQIFEQGFILRDMTVEDFAKMDNNKILYEIRQKSLTIKPAKKNRKYSKPASTLASETIRQLRAAVFISFTKFLALQSSGLVKPAIPISSGAQKTFGSRREGTAATLLSQDNLNKFLIALKSLGDRHYLFGILQLLAARRLSEVRLARVEDIHFEELSISFTPIKSGQIVKNKITVKFSRDIMQRLERYLEGRDYGYIFPHSAKKPQKAITKSIITKSYLKAWKLAGVPPPRMLSHSLRATTITNLFEAGKSCDEIQNLSGHKQIDMVKYYNLADKKIPNTGDLYGII